MNKEESIYISTVIPAYNTEENISTTLAFVKSIFESNGLNYEIIVVNDGSTDNTLETLQKEMELDDHITLISYPINRGKGHAVRAGVLKSRGEVVMFVDGDFEVWTPLILSYIKGMKLCDIVIGSKKHSMSTVRSSMVREILSQGFNFAVYIIVGRNMGDTQTGLKIGRGEIFRKIFKFATVNGYAFDVELLTIASALNFNIVEMPVNIEVHKKIGITKVAKMILDLVVISFNYNIRRRIIKQLSLELHIMKRHEEAGWREKDVTYPTIGGPSK